MSTSSTISDFNILTTAAADREPDHATATATHERGEIEQHRGEALTSEAEGLQGLSGKPRHDYPDPAN